MPRLLVPEPPIVSKVTVPAVGRLLPGGIPSHDVKTETLLHPEEPAHPSDGPLIVPGEGCRSEPQLRRPLSLSAVVSTVSVGTQSLGRPLGGLGPYNASGEGRSIFISGTSIGRKDPRFPGETFQRPNTPPKSPSGVMLKIGRVSLTEACPEPFSTPEAPGGPVSRGPSVPLLLHVGPTPVRAVGVQGPGLRVTEGTGIQTPSRPRVK